MNSPNMSLAGLKGRSHLFVMMMAGLASFSPVLADEVHLKNGDRLSGEVISQSPNWVVLDSEAAGRVELKAGSVERILKSRPPAAVQAKAAEPEEDKIQKRLAWTQREWSRQAAVGLDISQGNTEKASLSARLGLEGRTGTDAWSAGAEIYFSENDDVSDAQRYSTFGRYANSYGEKLSWYNFYKAELSHDRFANVDWRLTPTAGVGYWWSEQAPFKAMTELGAGLERTQFRDSTPSRSAFTIVARGWAEKELFRDSKLTQEVTLWPRFGDGQSGEFRFKSETKFSNPLTEKMALNLRFIDEFDSDPAGGTKKNDLRLISDLSWDF